MSTEKQQTIRCIGYKVKDKVKIKCRNKIKINKDEISLVDYFCCKDPMSKNIEDLMEGCDICGDEVNKFEEVIILKCNHAYHKQCYYRWLNKNSKNICPICLFEYKKHRKKNKKKFVKKKKKKEEEQNSSNINVSFNSWENPPPEELNNQESLASSWDTEPSPSNNWGVPSLNINNNINNNNNNLSEILNQNDTIDFTDINELKEQKDYFEDMTNTVKKWKDNGTFDISNIDFDKIIDDINECKKNVKYDFIGKLINTLYCKIKLMDKDNIDDTKKVLEDKINEFVSDEDISKSYNESVNNIIELMKKNDIDDNVLRDVITHKILNCGLFDKDEFDEYYDIHGIDEVNINSKYYELFQSIPDINIS
jgi:hypothetical protein